MIYGKEQSLVSSASFFEELIYHSAEYGEFIAVSIVVGLRFSLSTAYALGDMGRRSEGDCGSVESLRIVEMGIKTEGT